MKFQITAPLLLAGLALVLLHPSSSMCTGNDSVSGATLSTIPSNKDSVSPSINAEAHSSASSVDTSKSQSPAWQRPFQIFRNTGDTILVLTNKTVQDFMRSLTVKHRGSRERGYGGCIGFSPGIYWIDMKPIRSLVNRVNELKDIGFDLSDRYKMMSLPGGMLYGGLGNGMRIGLEGRGGSRSISKDFHDTTFFLDMSMGYGGLLLEKAFVAQDMNYIIGAVAGAGGISIQRNHVVGESGFSATMDYQSEPDGSASATIMVLQLHAAFTYSVLPWIHIGMGGVAPMFFSTGGFQVKNGRNITDGFSSVNFGVQVRLMLGNLG